MLYVLLPSDAQAHKTFGTTPNVGCWISRTKNLYFGNVDKSLKVATFRSIIHGGFISPQKFIFISGKTLPPQNMTPDFLVSSGKKSLQNLLQITPKIFRRTFFNTCFRRSRKKKTLFGKVGNFSEIVWLVYFSRFVCIRACNFHI